MTDSLVTSYPQGRLSALHKTGLLDTPPEAAGPARVLLADDNADMLAYVSRLLRRAGYEVAAVADGEQALTACLANPPDLILTEVMLPGLDGFVLVGRLRGDERTALLPIILLSAQAGEEARVEGLEAGADDYIVKPFGSRELLARVDAAVRLSRARKEALSREAEIARLRASFEDAAVGIAHVATDGRWLRVNDRLCAMTGYSREELLAKSIQDITHPGDLKADLAALHQLLAGEIATHTMEKRYFRKDGEIVWINLTVSLVRNADGIPGYFLSVTDDITARKQASIELAESRSRLAGVVDSAMDAIISIDARQKIVLFNRAAEKMFQREAADVIGQGLSLLLPQRFAGVHAQQVDAFAKTSVSNRAMDNLGKLSALRADGTEFPIEASISQTSTAGEKVFTAILRDITEQRRAEEQAELLMREVNHRAKNMLAVVQSIALQTASTRPDDFIGRFGERIQALATSQDLLVENEWRGVDIAALVKSQLAHFDDLIGTRIKLKGPPVFISASAAQTIGMALHELCTNAGKYGALSNGDGHVEVGWNLERAGGAGGAGGDEEAFVMHWREAGGPPVTVPAKRGFGSTVIQRLAKESLDAEVDLDFAAGGLSWRLRCPAKEAVDTHSSSSAG